MDLRRSKNTQTEQMKQGNLAQPVVVYNRQENDGRNTPHENHEQSKIGRVGKN